MANPGKFDESDVVRDQSTGEFAAKVGDEAAGGTDMLVAETHFDPPRQVSATMTLTGPDLPEQGLEVEVDNIDDVGHHEVVKTGDGYEVIWSERYEEHAAYDWGDMAEFESLHSQPDADAMSKKFQSGELDRDDPHTFLVERYDHGVEVYGLPGESSQVDRKWDVTPVAGYIKVPNDVPKDRAEDYARGALDEFNGWNNGDTHAVHSQRFDRTGNRNGMRDSVYGMVGGNQTKEYVEMEAEGTRSRSATNY